MWSGNLTLPTILVRTLFFFVLLKEKYLKIAENRGTVRYSSRYGSLQFSSTGIVAWVITGRSYNRTSATSVFVFNHQIFRVFFPISVLKVMDSVSVLLNIFKPKCEHAAEHWTFKILKCSLSFKKLESCFLCHPAIAKKIPT